jgi:hypothetical protein
MISKNERGSIALIAALGVSVVLFIAAAAFGLWAFASRQDYKDNADKKIGAAVEVAKQQTATAKDKEFVEKEKSPVKGYTAPETFGKLNFQYPKNWSAYVDEKGSSGQGLDGYFHPNFVPGLQSGTNFALRVQVVSAAYDQVLRQFDSGVKSGAVRVSPYQPSKVANVVGARVDGQIDPKKQGSLVILPLRDKTIKIWTESDQFQGDFNNTVLANLTFVP